MFKMDNKTFKWITISEPDGEDYAGRPIYCNRNYCPVCHYGTWLTPDECPECGIKIERG